MGLITTSLGKCLRDVFGCGDSSTKLSSDRNWCLAVGIKVIFYTLGTSISYRETSKLSFKRLCDLTIDGKSRVVPTSEGRCAVDGFDHTHLDPSSCSVDVELGGACVTSIGLTTTICAPASTGASAAPSTTSWALRHTAQEAKTAKHTRHPTRPRTHLCSSASFFSN